MNQAEDTIRVLQVNIAGFGYGGMSTMIYKYGQQCAKENVIFDYVPQAPIKYMEYVQRIQEDGGKVYLPDFRPNDGILRRKWLFLKMIRKCLKEEHYKILHINVDRAYDGLACAVVGKWSKTPVVIIHCHNTGIDGNQKSVIKNVLHRVCRFVLPLFSSYYWGCSQEAVKWMASKWAMQKYGAEIIRYGIETDQYLCNEKTRARLRVELGLQDHFVVGSIGRLSLQKNQFFLMDIFKEILACKEKAMLLLIGEGTLKQSLEEYAQRLGIEKKVVFVKNVQRVSDFLQVMDVFVFPSLFEGLGIVVLEAQAAGLPTFISDGVPDAAMVAPYCKKISLNKSAADWACEILKSSAWDYDKRQGTDYVKNAGYDLQQAAQRVCGLYRDYLKHICG